MKWKKFRIKTVTEAEDIIISTLYDLGLEGAQIEDSVPLTAWEKEQMFVDIMPDAPADDGIAYLNFFVEEDEEGRLIMNGEVKQEEKILEEVKEELESLRMFCDIGEGVFRWMRRRILTGSTTGRSISNSSILMIFWSFPPGRRYRKRTGEK